MEALFALKESGEIHRLGTLFSTNSNNYFYDTGTQKIIALDEQSFDVLQALFNEQIPMESLTKMLTEMPKTIITEMLSFICRENLLCAPEVKNLYLQLENVPLKEIILSELDQIVLEVTEACNFRCKYCVYNEDNEGNRDFGFTSMNFSTAKKAVDYIFEHGSNKIAITFYGGEPLIKFPLIKKVVEYALSNNPGKDLSFSITSNMTLMTNEIAEFIAQTPNFSIVASIDGPPNIHDIARVYVNNEPTSHDALRGLEIISKKMIAAGRESGLSVNTVLIPPFTTDKFEEINSFFSNLEYLPKSTTVQITYPSPGTYPMDDYIQRVQYNPQYLFYNSVDPLGKWQLGKAISNGIRAEDARNIYTRGILQILLAVNNRGIMNPPSEKYHCNGCCLPGSRKLYVMTQGDLRICERIGESPIIGNISSGIDFSILNQKYVTEYVEQSLPFCSNCWAINMCPICYAHCFNKNGVDIEAKRELCDNRKDDIRSKMSIFYSLLEQYPDVTNILRDVDIG